MNVSDLKPGDKIYVSRCGTFDMTYTPAKVVRVTPSGMVDVVIGAATDATRFSPSGEERGAFSSHYRRVLELDTTKVEKIIAGRQAQQEAVNAVYAVRKHAAVMSANTADVAKMEELLAELKARIKARG